MVLHYDSAIPAGDIRGHAITKPAVVELASGSPRLSVWPCMEHKNRPHIKIRYDLFRVGYTEQETLAQGAIYRQ